MGTPNIFNPIQQATPHFHHPMRPTTHHVGCAGMWAPAGAEGRRGYPYHRHPHHHPPRTQANKPPVGAGFKPALGRGTGSPLTPAPPTIWGPRTPPLTSIHPTPKLPSRSLIPAIPSTPTVNPIPPSQLSRHLYCHPPPSHKSSQAPLLSPRALTQVILSTSTVIPSPHTRHPERSRGI